MSTSRGSPSPTRFRLHLGIQEQAAPKLMHRTHTDSVLDVLYMDGKRISWSFQWHRSHIKLPSESTGIVQTSGRPESVMVLRHHLLTRWALYRVGVHLGRVQGSCTPLTLIYSVAAATLGFGVLLRFILSSNNITVHRFVRPHFVINTVLIATFLFLLVFSVALAGISLLGEVIRVTRVITNGAVV